MEIWQLIILFCASFLMSILSGITGAGSGFIITPLMIALGMTPAQAVSTGKIGGILIPIGSLGGLRKSKEKVARNKIIAIMILALVIGLIAPFVIKTLDNSVYRIILGIILLLMIPVMILKKVGVHSYQPNNKQKTIGTILLSFALLLQGIFSGGLGSLVNIVLMSMLGMNATEANITKRWSQLILNITVIFGVISSGLILWYVAIVMIPASLGGAYIGGHIAVKKGNKFVMNVLIGLMAISALYLIFWR
ncbi:MAG: sulfite exporter TauE/SafE family protein [Candidatus Paceibacterota bacterium]|jgi:hypothetical protein